MIKLVAVVLLACVACGCDATAKDGRDTSSKELEVPFKWAANFEIRRPYSVSQSDEQKYAKLSKDLAEVDEQLEQAVPVNAAASVEANMKAAKQLWDKSSGLLSKRPALGLLLELPSAAESCKMDPGYKTFARMFVATNVARLDAMRRVRSLLHFYHQRHAQKCRPIYKQKFHELLANMDSKTSDALEKVQTVLENVSSLDLVQYSRPKFDSDAAEFKGLPDLLWQVALPELDVQLAAYGDIAKQVHNLMRSESNADGSISSALKKHVFEPCERFVDQFESVLAPARLDAAIRDGGQKSYLTDDEQFTRAMAQLRVCKHLVGEQRKASSQSLNDQMVLLRNREAKLAAAA